MKKKKLITMLTALVLVAVVGVGSTLAWMSETKELTNVFTVGNVHITLDEVNYVNGEMVTKATETEDLRTDEGNSADDYGKMYPGREVTKDPTIDILDNSEDCYLFMAVSGIKILDDKGVEIFVPLYGDTGELNIGKWEYYKNLDKDTVLYYYVGDNKESYGDPLNGWRKAKVCSSTDNIEPLFNKLKYNEEANEVALKDHKVIVKACAYASNGIEFLNIDVKDLFK